MPIFDIINLGDTMKTRDWIIRITCIIFILLTIIFIKPITNKVTQILYHDPKVVIPVKNIYARNYDFQYVTKTDNFKPYNYQELLNIYYSILDNGWEEFTFYCPSEYQNCLTDIDQLSNDQLILSYINNYVAPYNCFKNIYTSYDETGLITVKVTKLYSNDEIKYINEEVKKVLQNEISSEMSDEEKIKKLHDYIINNTRYDEKTNKKNELTESSTAYGLFKNHLATCNGYSDAMALFLDELNIKNYKIAIAPNNTKTGHVWNAVNINGEWLHLDLTWDDPISKDDKDYLYHKYFLVDNDGLADADQGEVNIDSHNFKDSIYLEFKKQ